MTTKAKGFKRFPLLWIEYYDHSGDAGWVELKDLQEPPILCRTVGFKVAETETSIHIMSTLTNDGGQGGNNEIVKSCIVSEKVIRKLF
tara:strand:+ start:599 stop:862 length:264 start_codon:yes stop_codon:yes gene_type:complete